MKFNVLTIFPDLISDFLKYGLIKKAIDSGLSHVNIINLRDYAINNHGQVDDNPYGGGSGMILRIEPVWNAVAELKKANPNSKVISFSPRGRTLNQSFVRELMATDSNSQIDVKISPQDDSEYIIICNRYEGIDQRVIDNLVDFEISLGDFILMGSELASFALLESCIRLIPGVLNNSESTEYESFVDNLLEHDHYTKPAEFQNLKVPDYLLSGNHIEIKKNREEEAYRRTIESRPDLLGSQALKSRLSVALIHYPVLGKQKEIVTSSITNIDLHDIARSCRTFGIANYYAVHPVKAMRRLSERILEHWEEGYGKTYNPNRGDALNLLKIVPYFDDVLHDIEKVEGKLPKIIATSARMTQSPTSFQQMRALLRSTDEHYLLLLGTSWGLADELLNRADIKLESIKGTTGYNHLSVRAAAAIMLEKLMAS